MHPECVRQRACFAPWLNDKLGLCFPPFASFVVKLMSDPTQRFSDRAETYVQYRPSYPPALIARIAERAHLNGDSTLADIGSGTGILTALLLPVVKRVYAVEPNAAMRGAAEAALGGDSRFTSVAAPAEATTLETASIDLITVAQAFHWFDQRACRREFARILRPAGMVGLIWNERQSDATPFEKIEARNDQAFDLPGVVGRALSTSYVPNVGQPGHEEFVTELKRIFQQHARHGQVIFGHVTRLYLGRLNPARSV
jgi:ubiquinone/menaquinone biosynthesis C-methylase UbiE